MVLIPKGFFSFSIQQGKGTKKELFLRFVPYNIYMRKIILFPLYTGLVLLAVSSLGFSQSEDKNAMKFAKLITAEDAKKHLSVLASDEYEGRETGQKGQKMAAKYIAQSFKNIGLRSVTDTSYLQKFPLTMTTQEGATLQIGDKKIEYLKDFYVLRFSSNLNLDVNNILFLGYGISDSLYNDYANTDVTGKILLVLDGEPMSKDSVSYITGKKELSDWPSFRKKSEFARKKGALAILVVDEDFSGNLEEIKSRLKTPTLKLETADAGKKDEKKKIPLIGISENIANGILAANKMTLEDIKKKIQSTKQSVSFEVKTSFNTDIKSKEEKISSENVLGMIEGSEFKDEVIFVTAHYDHLGVRDGKVFNGADDDGSGTTGVLEIANAFAKAKLAGFAPKRSLVFMTVAGEEKGLLGSSYYTDHPIFPIANTVCDLNIDMIGRFDEDHKKDPAYVYIIGSDKISTELHKINESNNSTYTKLKLEYKYNDPNDPNRFYYRSDHYNFAEKGVPIIFYFNGTHEDYHQETDEVSKINFDLLAKRAQLVFYTAWEVANQKDRIISDVPQEKPEKK